jgi:hypothetical protein
MSGSSGWRWRLKRGHCGIAGSGRRGAGGDGAGGREGGGLGSRAGARRPGGRRKRHRHARRGSTRPGSHRPLSSAPPRRQPRRSGRARAARACQTEPIARLFTIARPRGCALMAPFYDGGCQGVRVRDAFDGAPTLVGVNVVRPVGRSTLTPPARRRGGCDEIYYPFSALTA